MKHRASALSVIRILMPVVFAPWVHGADLHVSPSGSDSGSGAESSPFLTLAAARDAARGMAGKEAVTVHVADGTYYLPETFVLSNADSGSVKHPVVYQAVREGGAVLSGGLKLDLQWAPHVDGIFRARTPEGLSIDQLFIGGTRQRMARYPNFDAAKTTAAYQGYSADAFSNERAANWSDPVGGYIHAMHTARWGGYHYRITGRKPDGGVAFEGGWQNNRKMGMHKDFRMVENIFEELDAPGEWFHDRKTHTLYFKPEPGMDLSRQLVEVVRLRHLLEFKGSADAPVRHVSFKGFIFRHAARTFMETSEPLLRSDWAIYRGGAVVLTGTEDVGIRDCRFDQVGGNAVFINLYNRRAIVKGCHIHDAGASGVCFVGDPAAVRAPLFEYAESQDLAKMDRTAGPKTNNYPAESAVEDCLMHGIGRVERQSAGVQISMSSGISVRDTSIYDCSRSGINFSEGTWGGHLIEGCDVFDTVLETHDHGSFNSWGRDRYWTSKHRMVSEPEVKQDPKLPYLDVIRPIVIRNSRWRCDHGWDIDLDDGSSNYQIYNNVMLRGGLKFREGYGRKAWNNVLVNSGFHPHVWFDDSSSAFQQNIVMKPHAPIGQPKGWGVLVDRNLFASEADRLKHADGGCDAHSLSGDPKFVDAGAGDFRVKDGSPALELGFKNFPMDRFGVKKAALKAIAKTPVIPRIEISGPKEVASPAPLEKRYWLGAKLHALEGEEFSAFGVSKESGGVQLSEVPAGSAAAAAGFRTNDLIQAINGVQTTGFPAFFAALNQVADAPINVRIIRSQQPEEIIPVATPHVLTEVAQAQGKLVKLVPSRNASGKVTASEEARNDPLSNLTDGLLARSYGPVFANGVRGGAYKLDLGGLKHVESVTTWSYRQTPARGRQLVTIYGSAAETDPGWEVAESGSFTALCTLDTASLKEGDFTAASLHASAGASLGRFRWIVWVTHPLNDLGENTAFQELGVTTRD